MDQDRRPGRPHLTPSARIGLTFALIFSGACEARPTATATREPVGATLINIDPAPMLTNTPAAETSTPDGATAKVQMQLCVVPADSMNVRTAPSLDSIIFGVALPGHEQQVTGEVVENTYGVWYVVIPVGDGWLPNGGLFPDSKIPEQGYMAQESGGDVFFGPAQPCSEDFLAELQDK